MAQPSSTRYKAYHQASQTLAKTRQVVMLYDGAIRFLTQAKDAALQGDAERRYFKLARVGDILTALQASLDAEEGRDVAAKLHQFYQSLIIKVLHLHYATRAQDYTTVLEELKTMRAVWDAIDRDGHGAASTAMPALRQEPAAHSA